MLTPRNPVTQHSSFPADEADAGKRYDAALDNDPFPNIPPALLNSSDIIDYARQTAIVHEFDKDRLKSSSYAVRVGRKLVYWDDDKEAEGDGFKEIDLDDGEEFTIKRDSLIFITTEEKFFLPHYIAIRFNLHIDMVHRGLLLGTGPLVDPGFRGHLVVPLHNFTTNDYKIRQGQELIWVEFTKISPNSRWENSYAEIRKKDGLSGEFKKFDKEKKEKKIGDYLNRARADYKNGPVVYQKIQSSLPDKIRDVTEESNRTSERVKEIGKKINLFQWVGGIGSIVALGGLAFGLYQVNAETKGLVEDSLSLSNDVRSELEGLSSSTLNSLGAINEPDLDDLRKEQELLNSRIQALEVEIHKLLSPETSLDDSSP